MAQIIYRNFNDPATKKNWVPKYVKYKRILVASVFLHLIELIVILSLTLK